MIVLKWLLAMLLTSVPFVFHYCIKPKAASSDKWRNFYSFLSARMPWLKRKALAVKAWISYVYHKMYRSNNGRKFFTLTLVICMLVFQVVDFHAAKEACSFQVEWAAKGKALGLTPYDIGLPGIDGEVELGSKSFMENILYPFQTSLWVYMVALMMTLLLFSYRLADLSPTHGRYGLSVQAASACSRDEKQVAQLGFLATCKECSLGTFERASLYSRMVISKRNIQMVKENISSSESLPKEERFVINMSSELIAYLCNDYSYRNPNRFSRLKALQDLLIRFQKAKLASKDMDVNIAQLVKAWGWSRPAVLAFVDQLQKYEILEVCNMVTSKVVHLKPSIFSSGLSPTPGG